MARLGSSTVWPIAMTGARLSTSTVPSGATMRVHGIRSVTGAGCPGTTREGSTNVSARLTKVIVTAKTVLTRTAVAVVAMIRVRSIRDVRM